MYYQIPLYPNHEDNKFFEPIQHRDEIYDELADVLSNVRHGYQKTDELEGLIVTHPMLGHPIMVFKDEKDRLASRFIGIYKRKESCRENA